MKDTQPHDGLDNDAVEIIDLPDRDGSAQPYSKLLMRLQRKTHMPALSRALRVGLTLMICLLVLVVVTQMYQLSLKKTGTQQPAIQPTPTVIIGMSALNGFVYINESNGSIAAYRASDGKFSWRVNVGTAVFYTIASDSTIYCFLTKGDYGRIEAFRASDGSLLWTQQDTFAGNVNLMARDGILYINTERGVIHALRGSDGHQLWQFTAGMPMGFDGFMTINNGIVSVQTSRNVLYLLRESDGTQIYQYSSPLTLRDITFPSIQDGFITIVSTNESIQVRNINNGSLLWQHTPFGGVSAWPPTELGGIIFVNNPVDGSIQALRIRDGSPLWQFQQQALIGPPALDNGIAYMTAADGSIYALRASDGSQLWHKKVPASAVNISTPPHIDNHILYLNLDRPDTTVYAIQVSDGTILWQHALLAGVPDYTPTIEDGILYLGYDDHTIEAWQASTGHSLWQYHSSSHILWYPEVIDNLMYVRSFNGTMDVLRITDGKRLWHYPFSSHN